MSELVSIIVPVYNVREYLEECLDSIEKQTYKNIEVVLVNDGSTDGSLYILEQRAAKDNRFKVINKKNGGLSDARNAGLDVVSGEYISFIDSDDVVAPTMIERLMEQMRPEVLVVQCKYHKFSELLPPPEFRT